MKLGQEQVQEFLDKRVLVVDGVTLDEDCFVLTAKALELPEEHLHAEADLDFAVVLDTTITPELKRQYHARELTSRIQKLRKDADLNPDV